MLSLPKWNTGVLIVILLVILLFSIFASIIFGSANISSYDILLVLAKKLQLDAYLNIDITSLQPLTEVIIWQARMPRILTAALIGAALTVSGLVLQIITRNPLAEPYLLGISSGASTGAVMMLLFGMGSGVMLSSGAYLGAIISFVVLLLLTNGTRSTDPTYIVLTGVLISQFFSAITSIILMVNGDANSTRGFIFWLLGSLDGIRWQSFYLCVLPIVIGIVIIFSFSACLDAFSFGAETALTLGINVIRVKFYLILLATIITASAVSAAGAIGFIGLIVPHIIRRITNGMHITLIPVGCLVGAIFLIWADTLARYLFTPISIPVGVITAFIGAPIFGFILRNIYYGRND